MYYILMYSRILKWLTKMSKVHNVFPVGLASNKVGIMLEVAEMQNFKVQNVEVHCFPVVHLKCQMNNVFHTCRSVTNTVKDKSNHDGRINQFIDVNPYQILADIDFSIVISCQCVNVNNVMHDSDVETGCKALGTWPMHHISISTVLQGRIQLLCKVAVHIE